MHYFFHQKEMYKNVYSSFVSNSSKLRTTALAGVAQLVGVSSHRPKDCWFDSWSGCGFNPW